MDLKLKDVADLLNVSENTVRRWVSGSRIPNYRLKNEFRFNRDEIESWMLSCKQEGDFSPFDSKSEVLGTQHFGLYRAIHKGNVSRDIEGTTKEEVIKNAVKQIAHDIHLDAEVITNLLLDREK